MGLLPTILLGGAKKKRAQIISVDLGARTTKAVLLERRGERFALTRYALIDAPISDKKVSPDQLSIHLQNVADALGKTTKFMTAAVGMNDSIVRIVDLPPIPLDEMRSVLKMNHKSYLQQDLPNHTFDCYIIPPTAATNPNQATAQKPANNSKVKVLTVAARQQLITDFLQAANSAGLVADALVPSLIGPVNAFEMSQPAIFKNEVIALVDIGFRHSTVCVLDRGELFTNRVINIGGDQITNCLTESRGISYAEAEGIKVGMPSEVESELQSQVIPLGREIRASLDFFEHQQDRAVSQVYVSGGTARSDAILQMLTGETIAECKTWNPTSFLETALPPAQAAELEHVGPQLAVAIGAALATL